MLALCAAIATSSRTRFPSPSTTAAPFSSILNREMKASLLPVLSSNCAVPWMLNPLPPPAWNVADRYPTRPEGPTWRKPVAVPLKKVVPKTFSASAPPICKVKPSTLSSIRA